MGSKTDMSKKVIGIVVLGVVLLMLALWSFFEMGHATEGRAHRSDAYSQIDAGEESCVQCHTGNSGFSKFHDPDLIGCAVCHLGHPEVDEKKSAHDGMVLIPGNLSNAAQTCGTCHQNELHKIEHSLMTTNSGLVAVDKYVFGESDSPDHSYDIRHLGHGQTDDHLRTLCANCHLGAEKSEFGPVNQLSRGGGCNACHLNYTDEAHTQLKAYVTSGKEAVPKVHPSIDIKVGDEHCFGCHSRSSRISTNFMGWHETLLEEEDIVQSDSIRVFDDKRVYRYIAEDVHHSKGMLCIDCHSSHEVMGDGRDHLHEEDAVSLSCADCHYREKPDTISYEHLDVESKLVFMHRNYTHMEQPMLKAKKDGHPLVNTLINEKGQVVLLGKKDGKEHPISPQGDICSRDSAHRELSCSSCHSQWAPRCIGCHNTFDPNATGYDLLDKKMITGTWMEHVFEFDFGPPAIGVREKGNEKRFEPAIPGMVLTIDHSSHVDTTLYGISFKRLYAPNAPHTTSKTSRSCVSCHADPVALGYGKGSLLFVQNGNSGTWRFEPTYAYSAVDGLPEDAWIPFLKASGEAGLSTRSNFRSLNIREQQNMLRVATCLRCHQPESEVMRNALKVGLKPLLLNLSDQCVTPEF